MSLPTVKRVETERGPKVSDEARLALQRALVLGGVEFIDQNGGGPGVRTPEVAKTSKNRELSSKAKRAPNEYFNAPWFFRVSGLRKYLS